MSTGHVKVMLLLMGVVSFSAVWSNDQRPVILDRSIVAIDQEISIPGEENLSAIETEDFLPYFPPIDVDSSKSSLNWLRFPTELELAETIPGNSTQLDPKWVMLDELEFVKVDGFESPLPRSIAPGEYRVIDRFGNVSTQTISIEIASETGFQIGSDYCDSYTARENEARWHYIRIERDEIAEQAKAKLQADVRQAWKSMFRVIREKTERPIQNLQQPLENWLAPAEIAESELPILH